jgi:BTB/POZ domain-containing protein 1/2
MTVEEFASSAVHSNILTDKEVVSLFLHFTLNPKPSVDFLDKPRCCLTGREKVICRFQKVECRWGYSGTSDRIRFTCSHRIFVVGLGMYGSINGPSDFQVTIQLIESETSKVCGNNDTAYNSDGTESSFRVMFKEPVEVLPNVSYTANATLRGPDSHYGTSGQKRVVHDLDGREKIVFNFYYATGNNNGTSVEDGQIPEIIFYT